MEPGLAYLHYLSILLIAGFLTGELLLCRPGLDAAGARLLPRVDVEGHGLDRTPAAGPEADEVDREPVLVR